MARERTYCTGKYQCNHMKLKKGKYYRMTDPSVFIEEGEDYDLYRGMKIRDEMRDYIADGYNNCLDNGVVFHTKESLYEVCHHFYMMGLKREGELHPKLPLMIKE